MEDTVNKYDVIKKIAEEIEDLKGSNTIAIDVSQQSSWTSYFIISTVSSSAHLRGILKDLYDTLELYDLIPQSRHKKIDSDKWLLIDCGELVIHLMDREARDFYDLEKLWFTGDVIYGEIKEKPEQDI